MIAQGTPSASFGPLGSQNRLDRQTFVLPNSFANDTLTQIIYTDQGGSSYFDSFIAAVTVGSQPTEITLPGSTAVHSATVGRNLHITGGALTIGAGTSSFIGVALDGGTITPLDGATVTGSVINGSNGITNPAGTTLTVDGTLVNVPFTNNGTLVARHGDTFAGGLTTSAGSSFQVYGESVFTTPPETVAGDLVNHGTIAFTGTSGSYAAFAVGGTLTNAPDGTIFDITSTGYTYHVIQSPTLVNQGAVVVEAGASLRWQGEGVGTTTPLHVSNSGTITVGGQLTAASQSFTNTGSVIVPAGGNFSASSILLQPGSITGDGRIALTNVTTDSDFATTANYQLSGTVSGPGTITNTLGHTLTLNSATANTPLFNQGTLILDSSTSVNAALVNQGYIDRLRVRRFDQRRRLHQRCQRQTPRRWVPDDQPRIHQPRGRRTREVLLRLPDC